MAGRNRKIKEERKRKRAYESAESLVEKARKESNATDELFAKYKKMNNKPTDNEVKARIGYGMEPIFKAARIKRDAVKYDELTKPVRRTDKGILYAAGFALNDTES